MKKIICLILALFFTLSLSVKADDLYEFMAGGDYIPSMYISRVPTVGSTMYMQSRFMNRKSDNAYVYCIEPMVLVAYDTKYQVYSSNQDVMANISASQWERMNLIAYYGYGYDNHIESKWFAISQLMIWRTARPDIDTFFTGTLSGTRITTYDKDIAEIENLINIHYLKPEFDVKEINIKVGETIRITDKNNVLYNYVYNNYLDNIDLSIENDKLVITGKNPGSATLSIEKNDYRYQQPPLLYYHFHSQKMMAPGKYESLITELKINVLKEKTSKLKVIKVDEETKEVIKEFGVKFKLTNLENKESFFYETNELGYFITAELKPAKYLLEELEAPVGYLLNKSVTIEITENSKDLIILEFGNPKLILSEPLLFELPNTYMSF